MNKLTIYEIKEKLENVFPELVLGWESETGKPNIISKKNWQVIAYTYHKKWILKPAISDYANHIAAIISLLERWDGKIKGEKNDG